MNRNNRRRVQSVRMEELAILFRRKRIIEAKTKTERKDSDWHEYTRIIDRLIDLL